MTHRTELPDDDEHLLELVLAIADGGAVDWSTPPAAHLDASLGPALQRLEVIVRGHQDLHSSPPYQPSEHTILTEARGMASGAEDLTVHWGPLVVLEKVGRGSFGDVYRARDSRLDRDVALKLVHNCGDAAAETVFQEGRLLARVRHPNVIAVYGAERVGQRVGIWMEYVHGRTLAQEVAERGRLSAVEAASIGIDICRALGAVHRAGLLHRDVKAQNVMRDRDGRIVLGDFGTGISLPTGLGSGEFQIAGTPVYLAPEVLCGHPANVGTDLYSLGVLLYFLTTASYPITARTLTDVRRAHERGIRARLQDARPDLPPAFVTVVDGLLEPEPGRRYRSTADVESALTTWLNASHSLVEPAPRWPRRAIALATTCLILIGVVVFDLPGAIRAAVGKRLVGSSPISSQLPDPPCLATPSKDGRRIACIEDAAHLLARRGTSSQPLVLFDPREGQMRILRTPAQGERYLSAVVSPDGGTIAYVVHRTKQQTDAGGKTLTIQLPVQLRVISSKDSADRLITEFPLEVSMAAIYEWAAADDRLVLRVWRGPSDRHRAVLVSPETGRMELLHEFEQPPHGFSRSPDGRFLAFDVLQAPGRPERDIRICDLIAQRCETLIAHPGFDFAPRWAPDGRLLFTSDRSGTYGLWAARLEDLRLVASPQLLRDTGRAEIRIAGFGPDDLLFYRIVSGGFDVYAAGISDPQAPLIPVRLSPRAVDTNKTPAWSPDGQLLAYVSRRGPYSTDGAMRLVIQDQASGLEREWPIDAPANLHRLAWSPDGSTLAVRTMLEGTFGVHLFDVESSALRRTLRRTDPPKLTVEDQINDIAWTALGQIMFASVHGLHTFDVESGAERSVWSAPEGMAVHGMSLDPDQSRAAAMVSDNHALGRSSWFALITISLADGSWRELLRATRPDFILLQAWSREGIFITRQDTSVPSADRRARLFLVSPEDGSEVSLSIPMERMEELRVHPGGRRVAFAANSQRSEFWMTTFK